MWKYLIITALAAFQPIAAATSTLYVVGDAIDNASETGFVSTSSTSKRGRCEPQWVAQRVTQYLSVPGTVVVPVTVSECGSFRDSDLLRALDWVQRDVSTRGATILALALDVRGRAQPLRDVLDARAQDLHTRGTVLVSVPGYWDSPVRGTVLLPFDDALQTRVATASCKIANSPFTLAALAGSLACVLLVSCCLCVVLMVPRLKAAAAKQRADKVGLENARLQSDLLRARTDTPPSMAAVAPEAYSIVPSLQRVPPASVHGTSPGTHHLPFSDMDGRTSRLSFHVPPHGAQTNNMWRASTSQDAQPSFEHVHANSWPEMARPDIKSHTNSLDVSRDPGCSHVQNVCTSPAFSGQYTSATQSFDSQRGAIPFGSTYSGRSSGKGTPTIPAGLSHRQPSGEHGSVDIQHTPRHSGDASALWP